jgi:hypothetical protein
LTDSAKRFGGTTRFAGRSYEDQLVFRAVPSFGLDRDVADLVADVIAECLQCQSDDVIVAGYERE